MENDERFFNWTKFEHYSEREYYEYLTNNLPEGYYVIHSRYLETDKIHYEVDFIVLCPGQIYLVEQKCWGDEVIGNDTEWEVYYNKKLHAKRPSPYRMVQQKARKLIPVIKKTYFDNIPLVSPLIILGSPPSRKIRRQLQGNCAVITFSPEESLKIFLNHKKSPNSKKKRKQNNVAKTIYDSLIHDLKPLQKITVQKIQISDKSSWQLEIENINGEVKILNEKGNLKLPFQINITLNSPNLQTEYYFEIVEYLKVAVEIYLKTAVERGYSYIDKILKICQSWLDAIREGKLMPSRGFTPLLKLSEVEDVYKYLSGGLVRNDIDYHHFFKKFRDLKLKPKSDRENFIVLESPVGMGKTTQLCRLAYEYIESGKDVYLVNPEISLPSDLHVFNSVIIVDRFARIHPKDIQILVGSALEGRNIVYCALQSELKFIVEQNYNHYMQNKKFPWITVKLPLWPYNVQYDVFSRMKEDWKCFVVEESIPSILQSAMNNPILLSEALKFPERTRGSMSRIELIFGNSLSGIGIPAIYIKYLRLITDFIDLTNERSENIVKSIYTFVQMSEVFPEYIWRLFDNELDLLQIDNPIMQSLIPDDVLDRYFIMERWKVFFQLISSSIKELFLMHRQPGEKEKFKQVFRIFNPKKWNKEIEEISRNFMFENKGNMELNLLEKTILTATGFLDSQSYLKMDDGQFLLELAQLSNNYKDPLKIQLELAVIATIIFMQEKNRGADTTKIEKLLGTIPNTLNFDDLNLFVICLRNLVECGNKEEKKLNLWKKILNKHKQVILDIISSEQYINNWQESFPIEIYRIALVLDEEMASSIKNSIKESNIFKNHLKGLLDFYWLEKYRNGINTYDYMLKVCEILTQWLWELKNSHEEIKLWEWIINLLSNEYSPEEVLCICSVILNKSFEEKPEIVNKFVQLALSIANKAENTILIKSMEIYNTIYIVSNPNFKTINFSDFNEVNEIYMGIMEFIRTKRIEAAKQLLNSKRDLVIKYDEDLVRGLDLFLNSEPYEKDNFFVDLITKIEEFEKKGDYDKIIKLTENLPDPTKSLLKPFSYQVWRSRGTALRYMRKYNEAFESYLIALSLSYFSPDGEFFRSHILGQIGFTLESNRKSELHLLLRLLIARGLNPHLNVRRIDKPDHLSGLENLPYEDIEQLSIFGKYSLTIYDIAHLLAQSLAATPLYKYAYKLAKLALEDAILNNNVRAQCFSLIILSRIAFQEGDLKLEEEYFNKYLEMSLIIDDIEVRNLRLIRKKRFRKKMNSISLNDTESTKELHEEEEYFKTFFFNVQNALESGMVSQDLFSQGLSQLYMFKNSMDDLSKLIEVLIVLFKIMPKEIGNFLELVSIFQSIDMKKLDMDSRKVITSLSWQIMFNISLISSYNDISKLLEKVISFSDVEDKAFIRCCLVLYWLEKRKSYHKDLQFEWKKKGLLVSSIKQEFLITIGEIKNQISPIFFSTLDLAEDRILDLTKDLNQIFPNPYIIDTIGDLCFEMKLIFIAKRVLLEGSKNYPENMDLHLSLAQIRIAEEDTLLAKEHLLKVLEIDENDLEALAGLAMLYRKAGNYSNGIEYAKKIVDLVNKKDPRYRNSCLILAQFYILEDNYTEALNIIKNCLHCWPDTLSLTAALSYTYSLLKDYDEAQKYCKLAINLLKNDLNDFYSKFKISRSEIAKIVNNESDNKSIFLEMNLYELIVSSEDMKQAIEIGRYETISHVIILILNILLKRLENFYQSLQ